MKSHNQLEDDVIKAMGEYFMHLNDRRLIDQKNEELTFKINDIYSHLADIGKKILLPIAVITIALTVFFNTWGNNNYTPPENTPVATVSVHENTKGPIVVYTPSSGLSNYDEGYISGKQAASTTETLRLSKGDVLYISGSKFKINNEICDFIYKQVCVYMKESGRDETIKIDGVIPGQTWIAVTNQLSLEEALKRRTPSFFISPNCGDGCATAKVFMEKADGTINKFFVYSDGTTFNFSQNDNNSSGLWMRPLYETNIGTGVFARAYYSDGSAPFSEDWLWNNNHFNIQRIRREEPPGGCDIAKYNTNILWVGTSSPSDVTINGVSVGRIVTGTGIHGYIVNVPIKKGDKLCIGSKYDSFHLVIGDNEDVLYHYQSYCTRGGC